MILQASRGARSCAGDIMLRRIIAALVEMYPDSPIVLHQDDGNDDITCLSAIRHGVRKVNIGTDLRMAITGQMRKVARDRAAAFDPREFMIPAMKALESLRRARYEAFGTTDQAGRIKPIPLDDMANRYASGTL